MAEIELKSINRAVEEDISGFIMNSEKRYSEVLNNLIDDLEKSGAKIILLAGPSSSGKTTTANIIKDSLADRGHKTVVVSMDNFYRDMYDPLYPKDEKGELDYESVDALHVSRIHDCISDLLAGREVKIPKFIFGEGVSQKDTNSISLPDGGFVIIEGIHALNPVMTDGLDLKKIMKLFISVSTNINNDGKRILSGRKIRFIRRMTRDSLYRKTDAKGTLDRWESVLAGEDKYLYPYKDTADFSLDTFHEYELGAMKPFAMKAIESSGEALCGKYIDTIISALKDFDEIEIENVPKTSLIREFIPGGKYEDIY